MGDAQQGVTENTNKTTLKCDIQGYKVIQISKDAIQ